VKETKKDFIIRRELEKKAAEEWLGRRTVDL